jgi:hypothetical protein
VTKASKSIFSGLTSAVAIICQISDNLSTPLSDRQFDVPTKPASKSTRNVPAEVVKLRFSAARRFISRRRNVHLFVFPCQISAFEDFRTSGSLPKASQFPAPKNQAALH